MGLIFVFFLFFASLSSALNNGLALTPPMGWLSWERFRCITDCTTYPDSCISEQLYMSQADQLVQLGLAKLGYTFVNIDDCWSEMQRDANGTLVADKKRFPRGMKFLADYMHARGLKLGIYTDIGTNTCGGYPGSANFFSQDAATFASWGIDSVKVDGCYADTTQFSTLYPQFGEEIIRSGRPMVYYCSWPAYMIGHANFTLIAHYCNAWRVYDDIQDSSQSLYSIVNWWAKNNSPLSQAVAPGAWNDADMILAGNFGFSIWQQQMQMGLWSVWGSPLLMSNDLRRISQESLGVLSNTEVIAVSQDVAGHGGHMVYHDDATQIQWWTKKLSRGDVAVLALCMASDAGTFFYASLPLSRLGWNATTANVRDLFNHVDLPKAKQNLTLTLGPGVSSMVRLSR